MIAMSRTASGLSTFNSCMARGGLTHPKGTTSENARKGVDPYTSILSALADPSKYDERLIRRLANELKHESVVSKMKPSVKSKHNAPSSVKSSEDKRKFAMGVANAASHCLGTVLQSGWNASNPDTGGFSTDITQHIVSVFQMAISLLREQMPLVVDVERVASSFTAKLIAVQMVSST